MTPSEYAAELTFPARSGSAALAVITFSLLLLLADAAGLLGLWLGLVVLLGLFRHLTMLAVSRSRGRDSEPPDIAYFTVSDLWNLLPGLLIILIGAWANVLADAWGVRAVLVLGFAAALIVPAMIAVLVITRSAAQMVDPRAIARFIAGCGWSYLYAPLSAALVVLVPALADFLPRWASMFVEIYLLSAFFAVTGAITRDAGLADAVDIPPPAAPGPEADAAVLERKRKTVLDHAYGFISRGNLDGGLDHIEAWLLSDPAPAAGWRWFFDRMLEWENRDHALFFAQRYLSRLLDQNDRVAAVKLMLRARLENERFRPLEEDRPAAVRAAEATGNEALANALRRL